MISLQVFVILSLISPLITSIDTNKYKTKICEMNKNFVDGVIEFRNHRMILIEDHFFEYDYQDNYRRKGMVIAETVAYDRLANPEQRIATPFGRLMSGIYIRPFSCGDIDIQSAHNKPLNCTVILEIMTNVSVVVIYDQFNNKFWVHSKKYSLRGGSELMEEVFICEGNKGEITSDWLEGHCGPFLYNGRVSSNSWLLKGLDHNKKFRFLPMFFDPKNLTLFVILNKEYEMIGGNPSLLREETFLFWTSLQFQYPGLDWDKKKLSDKYTYTSFFRHNNDIYLVAEPYRGVRNKERGPSYLFGFDPTTKTVTESTDKSPFEFFGCDMRTSNSSAYIVISLLVIILLIVISIWIFVCYWFYIRGSSDYDKTSSTTQSTPK